MSASVPDSFGSRLRSRGFTLVELAAGIVTGIVILVGVQLLVGTSWNSVRTVTRETLAARHLRRAADLVSRELKQSSAGTVAVSTLFDQNHSLTFQVPVSFSAGIVALGARDRRLGATGSESARAGWSHRYTVIDAPGSRAGENRTLVREVLDAGGAVALEEVLAEHLTKGTAAQPGFRVVRTGSVWHVQITQQVDQGAGVCVPQSIDFDVGSRN